MDSFCWALVVHPYTETIHETNQFRALDAEIDDEVSRYW